MLVDLVNGDLASEAFKCGLDLLRIVLGDALLQQLRSALHELLRINQRQSQHTLNFLDDLGLRSGFKGLKLDGEQCLFGGGRRSRLVLFNGGGCSTSSGSRWREGNIGDVKARLHRKVSQCARDIVLHVCSTYLQALDQVCGLEQRQSADLIHNASNFGVYRRISGRRALVSPLFPP